MVSKYNEVISSRVPGELKKKYREQAENRGVNVQDIVREALWEYVQRHLTTEPEIEYKKVRWKGNSFGLTIPRHMVDSLEWGNAQYVVLSKINDGILLKKV